MSEVTLHGYPVKAGDKVWSISGGFDEVTSIIVGSIYPIETESATYTEKGERVIDDKSPSLFWQPIDPAAIEAAKVKKEPTYEWTWQYTYLDDSGSFLGISNTPFYKSESDMLKVHAKSNRVDFIRIERSKREVKP